MARLNLRKVGPDAFEVQRSLGADGFGRDLRFVDGNEGVPLVDGVARRNLDATHDAASWRLDDVLHLHGLENQERRASHNCVSRRNVDAHDRALDRGPNHARGVGCLWLRHGLGCDGCFALAVIEHGKRIRGVDSGAREAANRAVVPALVKARRGLRRCDDLGCVALDEARVESIGDDVGMRDEAP